MGNDRAGIAGVDAGDAASRQDGRTPPQNGRDARKPFRTDWRLCLFLRCGRVDIADARIVDALDRRGFRLGNRTDRKSDDRRRTEQTARIGSRHVVLADMHAVGAGGQRHVDAIIDHERHLKRRERGLDRACLLHHRPRFPTLITQLDQGRSAGGDAAGQVDDVVTSRDRRIDDGVKPQIDRCHGAHSTSPRIVVAGSYQGHRFSLAFITRAGGAHGPFLRADQMPHGQILRGGQPAGRRRDCLRGLLDRRRLRSAGKILCRAEHRHRSFHCREGTDHSRRAGHAHHHHLQGVRGNVTAAIAASWIISSAAWALPLRRQSDIGAIAARSRNSASGMALKPYRRSAV